MVNNNKLFEDESRKDNPDNTRLLELLDIYSKEYGNGDAYFNVLNELMYGNSFLFFATKDSPIIDSENWSNVINETEIKMESLVRIDGLKILGVFTDKQSLMTWVRTPTQYTSMKSQDILNFAQYNGVDRIIINNNLPNMFVIERNKEDVTKHNINENSEIKLEPLKKKLDDEIIKELINNFKTNKTISEVYQYGLTQDGEFSMVLAFKLTTYTEFATTAAINIVQNAIQNKVLDEPLDIFFIESEDWYESIKEIEGALIYKNQ